MSCRPKQLQTRKNAHVHDNDAKMANPAAAC